MSSKTTTGAAPELFGDSHCWNMSSTCGWWTTTGAAPVSDSKLSYSVTHIVGTCHLSGAGVRASGDSEFLAGHTLA